MKAKICSAVVCALLASFVIAGSGCASYVISKKYRQDAAKDISVPTVQKDPKDCMGKIVIWGGRILSLTNDSTGTTLVILESPLDDEEYPKATRFSRGRFIATTSEFLDPAIIRTNTKVTLAGEIAAVKTDTLGKGTYPYPLIKIEELRIWVPAPYYYGYRRSYPSWWYGWPNYYYYGDDFFDGGYPPGYFWGGRQWDNRGNFRRGEEREGGFREQGERHEEGHEGGHEGGKR
jgi:outer membrane lipoprotein